MSTYNCEVCKMEFKTAKTWKAHMKTKRHVLLSEGDPGRKSYTCGCGRLFMYRQSLYLHRKTCTTQTTIPHHSSPPLPPPPPPRDTKTEEIEKPTKKQTRPYGEENISYLTESRIMMYALRIYDSLSSLIKSVHFNPKYPENWNIVLPNKRNPYVKVLKKDNKWHYTSKDTILEELISKYYGMLEETWDGNQETVSEFKRQRFTEFQQNYLKRDKQTMKRIKQELDLALMNRDV